MVSESFNGAVSPIGDGLALLIAVRVLDRHGHHPPLRPCPHDAGDLPRHADCGDASPLRRPRASPSPAPTWPCCLPSARSIWAWASPVSPPARGWSRRPSPRCSAPSKPFFGPIWVWLVHAEVPSARTIVGGAVVFAALLVHIGLEFKRQSRPQRPASAECRRPIDKLAAARARCGHRQQTTGVSCHVIDNRTGSIGKSGSPYFGSDAIARHVELRGAAMPSIRRSGRIARSPIQACRT